MHDFAGMEIAREQHASYIRDAGVYRTHFRADRDTRGIARMIRRLAQATRAGIRALKTGRARYPEDGFRIAMR